jgi:tRNA A-37 threonylcarbamoyl transferase component Bud32
VSDATRDGGPGGRRFGRYRVVGELGVGAMGEVLLAHDDMLSREVAVKTLRAVVAAAVKGNLYDERLFREARAIAVLGHPNIVRIFDMGIEDGLPYLVMEAVRGPTLKQRLEQGTLDKSELRALGIQMARALDAAHGKGILHRDIKPSNILEAEPLTWKLADFGIAHTPDSSLTLTGQFLGTPMYAAPESTMAGQFSPASDVYGLAATLYEAACGHTVAGPGSGASLAQRLTKGVTPPGEINPGIPRDVERAIMAGLSLEIGERPSAAHLAELLARGTGRLTRQRSVASSARRPSRATMIAGAGVIVAAALVGGFVLGRSKGDETAARPAPIEVTREPIAVSAAASPEAIELDDPAPAEPAEAPPPEAEPPPEEAPPSEAAPAAVEPPAPRSAVAGLDEVKKLIAARRRESAIDRLQTLRKQNPKNAEVPFLLGNLYFEKQWWEQGFDNYRMAIKNDPTYRENPTLIRHAIQNLMSPSQNWRGVRFLTGEIGKPAIPHLEKAAKSGPGYIRKRAAQVLARVKKQR